MFFSTGDEWSASSYMDSSSGIYMDSDCEARSPSDIRHKTAKEQLCGVFSVDLGEYIY